MREDTIAERYARALLEIGVERGTLDTLEDELGRVSNLFKLSDELRQLVRHPSFDAETRKNVLIELMERLILGPTCRHFVLLLVDRGRISMIEKITQVFSQLVDAHSGRVRAKVTVAQPLSDIDKKRLERSLAAATGKQVILEHHVDSSVIAGVVSEVDGRVFDGSVRTRLNTLGARLRARV